MSRHGESTPHVDRSTPQGDRASKTTLFEEVLPLSETGPLEVQSHGGSVNAILEPTGVETLIQSELIRQLECAGLGIDNTVIPQLSSEAVSSFRSMSDSEFLAILAESDPSNLELLPFLEDYPPRNNDENDNEMEVGHSSVFPTTSNMYDGVTAVEQVVSETPRAPPSIQVAQAPFLVHQETSAMPRDVSAVLDLHGRRAVTESDAKNTFHKENFFGTFNPPAANIDSSSSTVNGTYYPAFSTSLDDDNSFIQSLASEARGLPSSIESELDVNPNVMRELQPSPTMVADSLMEGVFEGFNVPYSETFDEGHEPNTMLETQDGSEVAENSIYPRSREMQRQAFPRRRLLIEKKLSNRDIERSTGGVSIPKDHVEMSFGAIPESLEGQAIGHTFTIHDAITPGKKWIVKLTTFSKVTRGSERSQMYCLKDIDEYLQYHALEEGDWLQLFWEESHNCCMVKFERSTARYVPPSLQIRVRGQTWKLVIRKRLSQTDASVGRRGLGTIRLNKKDIQKLFPEIYNTGGAEIMFFDWDKEEIWPMAFKITTWKKTSYRLDGTAAFCKFHHLLKGDYVEIFRSDGPDVTYAIRGCKLDDRG